MKTEVKVGAFTLVGIALILGIIAMFSHFQLFSKPEYKLNIFFQDAIGLAAGNTVNYAGVKIGTIDTVQPDTSGVNVGVKIDGNVKIPKKTTVSITSSGVMGAKFINFQPLPDADLNDCYQDGDSIYGSPEAGLMSMMGNVDTAVDKVKELLTNLNDFMGSPEMKKAFNTMTLNMADITSNLKVMTASMARMSVANEAEINQMVQNLNAMTGSLMRASANVEQLVEIFNGDGETGDNLRVAVANLTATSKSIENMASALEGVVTDPQVANDLKATLHNVRKVSDKADGMMDTLNNTKFTPGLETMYSGADSKWTTDLDLKISNEDKFLKLGWDDIGDGNRVDAQVGMKSGTIGGRAGVIESKAGLGVDIGSKKLNLAVDAYDPNDFKLKSRLQYEVADSTYVFAQMNNVNDSDKRATYFGVRKEF